MAFRPLVNFLLAAVAFSPAFAQQAPLQSTSLQPKFFLNDGSKRVKLSYGPYTVPARSNMNGMQDYDEPKAKTPCTDCLITWMQADLHYANGTPANANTGLWLHHTVLADFAQEDLVCDGGPQRVFASGNERTPMDICANGTDEVGVYVPSNASWYLATELMNMADTPGDAIVSITYEYIQSPPPSFAHARLLWLDIGSAGGCTRSDMPAYPDKAFNYTSPEWIAKTDGRVTAIGAHLHDGGTHLEVKQNGSVICDSVAAYGGPDYVSAPMPMNMTMNGMPMEMNMSMEHISSLSTCSNTGNFSAGDRFSVTAHYNTSMHMPMQNTDGSLEDIMGISLVYFVEGTYVNASNGSHILEDQEAASTSGATQIGLPRISILGFLLFVVLLG